MSTIHGPYHISQPRLDNLVSGKKRVEGRKGTLKWKKIESGNHIIFFDKNYYKFLVLDVRIYTTIKEYLLKEGISNALPGIKTVKEGIKIYKQWTTDEEENKYGFLAIEVKFLTKLSDGEY